MEKEKKKYYYYKKKRGRKKKRGPKPKPKKRGRRWQEPWLFKIITCNNKIQDKYIGKYRNITDVMKAKMVLEDKNNNVIFPMKYIQNGRLRNSYKEYNGEYVILKKKTEEDANTTSHLQNKYGKYVNVNTSSDIWLVYDRLPIVIEETFWVYGYNPRTERKTFQWINNYLIENSNNSFTMVKVMNNKVIFKYDDDIDFVLCKNKSDAIRLYNALRDKNIQNKQIVFVGLIKRNTEEMKNMLQTIQNKTGWTLKKVYKNSTL